MDGRVITGELACIDRQGNVVLQHAAQSLGEGTEERQMGMAIIPRQQRQNCLIEVLVAALGLQCWCLRVCQYAA